MTVTSAEAAFPTAVPAHPPTPAHPAAPAHPATPAADPYADSPAARSFAKAALDLAVAGVLLLLLAAPMVLIALAVRLESPGPAIYRQWRTGRDGRPFRVWKFRSMVDGADRLLDALDGNDADGLLFKLHADPRVTAVGGFLRRWSLDELPQLGNVLRREMSLVGPRPLPVGAHEFSGVAARRHAVRPGITGAWQVSGRSDTSWERCLELDLDYVDRWSLRRDLGILARTAGAVVRRHGAY